MKQKIQIVLRLTGVTLATSMLIFFATIYLTPKHVLADNHAQDNLPQVSSPVVETVPALTHVPSDVITFPISQKANEITIELLSVTKGEEFLTADICFEFPTNNPEWMLGDGPSYLVLSNGVQEVGVYSGTLLDLKTNAKNEYVGRCDRVNFPRLKTQTSDNLQIIVKRLSTVIPEKPDCAKAQSKLDAAKTGIVVACPNEPGLGGFIVQSAPENITIAQAHFIAEQAFKEVVEGPWIFNITP